MNNINVVEVFMNGNTIGRIALTPDSLCAFEYNSQYLIHGQSISPYFLPLNSGLAIAKIDPFAGGFGVFDDSLPDGWGSLILDRYLKKNGYDPDKLTILQRLALAGSAGRGALEYRPDWSNTDYHEKIDFEQLAADSEKILINKDYTGDSIDKLYNYAGSSGGARPKVFVKFEGKEWLVKFRASADIKEIGEIEYKYSLLAKRCGINMPETRLIEGKYFGVERFDRSPEGKIHTISAAGLLNADYRIPSLDYLTLLKVCHNLTKNIEEVYALFRLMTFNVAIKNRDDHAKNFSFQLIGNEWKLSPAYDILPSSGFRGYHTTTINNTGEPEISDIFEVADNAGLSKQRVKSIIEEVNEVVKFL